MDRTLKVLAVPALALGIGLVAGFALGQRQGMGMGLRFLEQEASGSLAMHVEAASCVRVADAACALELLDTMIDSAVLSLHARPGQPPTERAMGQAKVYRRVVPAAGPNAPSVRAALDDVPEPDRPSDSAPEQQTSGLGRLVARSGK